MSRGASIGDAVIPTRVRRRLPRNERELTRSGRRKEVVLQRLVRQQRWEGFAKGTFRLTHQNLLVGLSECFCRSVNSAISMQQRQEVSKVLVQGAQEAHEKENIPRKGNGPVNIQSLVQSFLVLIIAQSIFLHRISL